MSVFFIYGRVYREIHSDYSNIILKEWQIFFQIKPSLIWFLRFWWFFREIRHNVLDYTCNTCKIRISYTDEQPNSAKNEIGVYGCLSNFFEKKFAKNRAM